MAQHKELRDLLDQGPVEETPAPGSIEHVPQALDVLADPVSQHAVHQRSLQQRYQRLGQAWVAPEVSQTRKDGVDLLSASSSAR